MDPHADYLLSSPLSYPGVHKLVFKALDEDETTMVNYTTYLTKTLVNGQRFHVHELFYRFKDEGYNEGEYRAMNSFHSKLGAAIALDIKTTNLKPGSKVLYIGDETCWVDISHVSDIVGREGHVYVVGLHEIITNVDVFGDLVERENITILKTTAQDPLSYGRLIDGPVDVIVSQVDDIFIDQVENLAHNAETLLAQAGGSISFIAFIHHHRTVHRDYHINEAVVPNEFLHQAAMNKLRKRRFKLLGSMTLEPYWEDWGCIVGVFPSH